MRGLVSPFVSAGCPEPDADFDHHGKHAAGLPRLRMGVASVTHSSKSHYFHARREEILFNTNKYNAIGKIDRLLKLINRLRGETKFLKFDLWHINQW